MACDECTCEQCQKDIDCIDCGERIEINAFYIPTPEDERFWMRASALTGPLCEACKVKRDNREPSEPDGEVFRGGEAAAFQAEQMERVQREMKR